MTLDSPMVCAGSVLVPFVLMLFYEKKQKKDKHLFILKVFDGFGGVSK